MKILKKCRRYVSAVLMLCMIIQSFVVPGIADTASTSTSLEFQDMDGAITSEKSGLEFKLHMTIGSANPNISENIHPYIELGDSKLEFPNFVNGEYSMSTSSGAVVFTIRTRDDGTRYIEIDNSQLEQGSTIGIDFMCLYPEGVTNNGETTSAKLYVPDDNGDEIVAAEATITAEAEPNWNQVKSANYDELALTRENGVYSLSDDLVFTITEYDLNKYNEETNTFDDELMTLQGKIYTREFTMTDTYTFPEGMYIPVTSDAESDINNAVTVAGVEGAVVTPTVVDDKITGFTVTYTKTSEDETKQLTYAQPIVTINKDSVSFEDSFINALKDNTLGITSELKTEYVDIFGQTHNIENDVNVNVNFRLPKEFDESLESALDKSIMDVADQYGTYYANWDSNSYVVAGDIIIYKITSTNNGDVTIYDHSFTDTIPSGLELVTADEYNALKSKFSSFDNQNRDVTGLTNDNYVMWVDSEDGTVNEAKVQYDSGAGTITFSAGEMEKGATLVGYIALKVSDDNDASIANVAKLTSNSYTKEDEVTVEVHKKKPELKINKNADKTSVNVGEEINYTITLENVGTENSVNSTFEDILPSEVTYRSAEGVKVSLEGGATGDFVYDANKNAVVSSDVDLPIGSKIVITVPVTVNSNLDKSDSIVNNASLTTGDGEVLPASHTITKNKFNPDNYTITKVSDKKFAKAGEEISYTVELKNYQNYSKTYTEDQPLIITDTLPEGLEYSSVVVGSSGFTPSYDKATRTITLKFVGEMKANSTHQIVINTTVSEDVKEGDKITNIAVLKNDGGDDKPTDGSGSSTTITGSNGTFGVEKKIYDYNGNDVTDSKLLPDDNIGKKVTFSIKVQNTSSAVYNEMTVSDVLTGNGSGGVYSTIDKGKVTFTVKEIDGVNGVKVGDSASLSNIYWIGTPYKFGDLVFSSTDTNAKFYNEAFSIQPNGYVIIEYSLILNDSFNYGTNTATVNENSSSVSFAVKSGLPKLELTKEANKTEFPVVAANSKEELKASLSNLTFDYVINVANEGTVNFVDNSFKIVDVLPEGMELVGDENNVSVKGMWTNNQKGDISHTTEISGNQITVSFTDGFTIYARKNWGYQTIVVAYTTKLSEDRINELVANAGESDGKYYVQKTLLDNSVAISGNTEFISPGGEIVTTETVINTITVTENTMHPGVSKYGLGSFGINSTGNIIGIGSGVVTPGDCIAWSVVVKNGATSDGEGLTMSQYTVKDILPSAYTYMNASDVKIKDWKPSIVKTKADGTKVTLGYIDATVTTDENGNRIAVWDFNGGEYEIAPGEYITIEFATKIASSAVSGVISNNVKLSVDGRYTPDSVSSGSQIEGGISNNATFNILGILTNSYKQIEYTPDGHDYDPAYDMGDSRLQEPDNYVQGMQGETVTYTLNVENASKESIKEFSVIDRLPFVGDIGVIAGDTRGSAFDVAWNDFISATVYNQDGSVYKTYGSGDIDISFSNDRITTFNNVNAGDWKGESQFITDWSATPTDKTSMVRFVFPSEDLIPMGGTVKIKFTGLVPDVVTNLGESNIAWNNFAYSYKSTSTNETLIAEPAKVGVWVLGSNTDGEITVNKTFQSVNSKNETFYFGIFTNEGGTYKQVGSTVSLNLTGSPEGATGSVKFENLPYDIKTGTEYIVFETDVNGNILEGVSNLIDVSYSGNTVKLDSNNTSAVVGVKNVEITTETTTESTTESTTEETTTESTTETTTVTTTESTTESTTAETTTESTTETTEETTVAGPTTTESTTEETTETTTESTTESTTEATTVAGPTTTEETTEETTETTTESTTESTTEATTVAGPTTTESTTEETTVTTTESTTESTTEATTETTTESTTESTTEATTVAGPTTTESTTEETTVTTTESTTAEATTVETTETTTKSNGGGDKPTESTTIAGPTTTESTTEETTETTTESTTESTTETTTVAGPTTTESTTEETTETTTESTTESTTEATTVVGPTTTESTTEATTVTTTESTTAEATTVETTETTTKSNGGGDKPTESTTIAGPTTTESTTEETTETTTESTTESTTETTTVAGPTTTESTTAEATTESTTAEATTVETTETTTKSNGGGGDKPTESTTIAGPTTTESTTEETTETTTESTTESTTEATTVVGPTTTESTTEATTVTTTESTTVEATTVETTETTTKSNGGGGDKPTESTTIAGPTTTESTTEATTETTTESTTESTTEATTVVGPTTTESTTAEATTESTTAEATTVETTEATTKSNGGGGDKPTESTTIAGPTTTESTTEVTTVVVESSSETTTRRTSSGSGSSQKPVTNVTEATTEITTSSDKDVTIEATTEAITELVSEATTINGGNTTGNNGRPSNSTNSNTPDNSGNSSNNGPDENEGSNGDRLNRPNDSTNPPDKDGGNLGLNMNRPNSPTDRDGANGNSGNIPKTGDSNSRGLATVLLVIAIIAILSTVVIKKKK